jgi:thiosulfate/3-mercaptopyruvate sulfurtransferase
MKQIIEINEITPKHHFIDARIRHEPGLARSLFQAEHIPGALHVDMETELSSSKTGLNGRHPLPDKASLQKLFSKLGIDQDTHIIAYDDADHAGAARLWLLLKWMGHQHVQVLNGGLSSWKKARFPTESGEENPPQPKEFRQHKPTVQLLFKEELQGRLLVDARAPERYRGEVEPLDPAAGHIPGAKNIFYKTLFDQEGRFLPEAELRNKLKFSNPVYYCGSGVTAAVLLLASAHIGINASIYPGSWSEWCMQPNAKIEKE